MTIDNNVICHCCNGEFSLSGFEKHGGSNKRRPWESVYLLETDYPLSYYKDLEDDDGNTYITVTVTNIVITDNDEQRPRPPKRIK